MSVYADSVGMDQQGKFVAKTAAMGNRGLF
jgi:hypothetical protein